jgi:hypothetical protein
MHFTIGTIAIIPAIIDSYYRFFFDYITKLLHKPSCGHANGTFGGLNPRSNNFDFQAFLLKKQYGIAKYSDRAA